MCDVMFGYHQATTRFLVQSVDHPRPKLASNPAQVGDLMKQRIDESAGLDACSGMDRHPGRLIDHQEMFILEKNRYRESFGLEDDRFRFRFEYRDFVAWAGALLSSTGFAIQKDVARLHKSLDPRPRKAIDLCGEKKIQALSSVGRIDDDLVNTPFIHSRKISRAKTLASLHGAETPARKIS
jgi:hypothetical protein